MKVLEEYVNYDEKTITKNYFMFMEDGSMTILTRDNEVTLNANELKKLEEMITRNKT